MGLEEKEPELKKEIPSTPRVPFYWDCRCGGCDLYIRGDCEGNQRIADEDLTCFQSAAERIHDRI